MSRSNPNDRWPAYGFRIDGDCRSERRLVDWPAAFAGYAACDRRAEVNREAYLSAFTFGDDFRQRDGGWGVDVKGFNGACGAPWLWFDLDAEADLDAALRDARALCAALVELYALDGDDLLTFFSGSKGFHVGFPLSLCGSPKPSTDFNATCRVLAELLAKRQRVSIDTAVYDRVRAFRAPNSKHPKSGRHKRRLTFDELLGLRLDAIVRLAEMPEPFDVPSAPAANATAVADWEAAQRIVAEQRRATAERRAELVAGGAEARLNRGTLEFIRDGATMGDRARLLFSAAANLAEFGCPPALAHALLSEAALDSGLSPSEVRRQIDCGLEKGGAA